MINIAFKRGLIDLIRCGIFQRISEFVPVLPGIRAPAHTPVIAKEYDNTECPITSRGFPVVMDDTKPSDDDLDNFIHFKRHDP